MELNFDNEIDALLRQTAKGEWSAEASELSRGHLDADEISAFAEKALPEKARQRYIAHLSDCNTCRVNLSNVISLNSEVGNQAMDRQETVAAVGTGLQTPWYKKLFSTPVLAYGMGTLVLVFAGITAFTVWQSRSGPETAQSVEKPESAPVTSSPANTAVAEVAANNALDNVSAPADVSANVAVPPDELAGETSPPSVTVPSGPTVIEPGKVAGRDELSDLKTTIPGQTRQNEIFHEKKPADSEDRELSKDNGNRVADVVASQNAPSPKTAPGGGKIDEPARKKEKLTVRSGEEEVDEDASRERSKAARRISGKTFNYSNGVWYDSEYLNQTTTNIRRNSTEYKNLDSGLRSIIEELKGTVVVVWKAKALRIQ